MFALEKVSGGYRKTAMLSEGLLQKQSTLNLLEVFCFLYSTIVRNNILFCKRHTIVYFICDLGYAFYNTDREFEN